MAVISPQMSVAQTNEVYFIKSKTGITSQQAAQCQEMILETLFSQPMSLSSSEVTQKRKEYVWLHISGLHMDNIYGPRGKHHIYLYLSPFGQNSHDPT